MKGLDCGTSFIVLSSENKDGNVVYKDFRDAFYVIKPTTPIATKMIEKGLKGKVFVKDEDNGSFVILGSDALEKAVERNDSAKRPMYRGVVSAKEKDARKVLSYILKEVVGKAKKKNEKLVFCVPAQPIDQEDDEFDVGYHEDVVTKILSEQGYDAKAINEAEALCYAELENEDYTGVALSYGAGMVNCCVMLNGEPILKFSTTKCLSKDYLVSTDKGLLPIEHVEAGDVCIDNRGNCSTVLKKVNSGHVKSLLSIKVKNYTKNIDMTDNHRVWIKRKNEVNWGWVEAQDIKAGDKMGLPIIKPTSKSIKSRSMYLYRKNNKSYFAPKSRKFGLFLGYFLGDGTAWITKNNKHDGRVSCSFNSNKHDVKENMEVYIEAVHSLFNKNSRIEQRKDNCNIVHTNSKHLAKFLIKHCYNEDKTTKKLSIQANKIPHQMALGIIEGLLATDGWKHGSRFNFENTSSSVSLLLQNLLARFGINSEFTVRPPRTGGVNSKGEQIIGTKEIYRVGIGSLRDNHILEYLFTQKGNTNLPITKMDFLEREVTSIRPIEYNDCVYDLQMENETHCFSNPGGVVHNSGDWIDRMAAVASGETDSVVQTEKEGGIFTVGEPNENPVLAAVSSYYVRLVDYTVKQLCAHLDGHKSLPKFTNPLPIVIAGGTSKAEGFVLAFEQKLQENDFPLVISKVRHAADPLHAVAKGCLIAAQVF